MLLAAALAATAAETENATNKPAKVKVSGFGVIGNREMVRLLRNFQVGGEMPVTIDRTFVEDSALVLLTRANDEGYLRATLHARFKMLDGSRQDFVWTNAMDALLPRDFSARSARFKLKSGKRFYYKTITFDGLQEISEREANGYFVSSEMLLKLRRNRVFNPTSLRSSLSALREAYARAGYQDAVVTTNEVTRNDKTGAVSLTVNVLEGVPTFVRSVFIELSTNQQGEVEAFKKLTPNKPYSQLWEQELAQELQAEQYAKGYPDTTVEFFVRERQVNSDGIQVDLLARVYTGPLVRLGNVKFAGNKRTKKSVIESRIELKEGEPLNRVEAERSRQRLARLGVFDSVRLRYDRVDEDERDVVYELHEEKPVSLSVLTGFGSYELLRGGLEVEHRNFLGRAHNVRLRGLQSFKATSGDLRYTVPEIFGENVNLFAEGSGLLREEISFTREEYGGSIGIEKRFIPIKTDFSVRYDYEFLNALDLDSASTNSTSVQEALSAAFVLEMTHDRRDHPLLPRKGLKLFSRVEFAAAALGGNVDYQRLIVGASQHVDLRGGRYLHFGATHAMSFTLGGSPDELPFNKRYFPGGENSVRGYQEGEASPLDENGDQLGAETYTDGSVEFEQLLTKSLSIVTFFDAVGFAESRVDYPWDEALYSVGGGIRWRTLIGPVRLEYGYNLNPREHDPVGTLHFSIGMRF